MYFLMTPTHSDDVPFIFGPFFCKYYLLNQQCESNNIIILSDIDDSTSIYSSLSFSMFSHFHMEKACGNMLEAGKAYE